MASKINRKALSDVKEYARVARDAKTGKYVQEAARKVSDAAHRVKRSS